MSQNNKSRILKIGVGLLLLFILAGVAAQFFFSKEVKKALSEQVPKEINFTYSDVSTNVFLGKISLSDVTANSRDGQINFEAQSVTASGLRYVPLLQNGDITVGDIVLESPNIVHHQKEKDTTSKKDSKAPSKKYRAKSVSIQNGNYTLLNQKLDSVATLVGVDLSLSDIHFDKETATENIPFTYGDYQLQTGKGRYELSELQFMAFEQMQLTPEEGNWQQLVLHTKYSKAELSRRVAVEHDHYDLSIDQITLQHWDFGLENETPYLHLGALELRTPIFHVYRDKLLPDDTTHKKLYNQALRDLEMDLQVDSIQVSEGLITYKERVKEDVEPEQLSFTDIEATIKNLHSHGEGDVTIDIDARLMDNGPFTLDWSFDPQNKANRFLVKGSLSDFHSKSISPFLKSNVNAGVKGTIQQMYFTISGNELESQGDMQMKYDHFEFTVLKKDHLGVNKLLTAVVNLFTKNGEKTDEDGFRHGSFKVKRKQDKSFFNYLWINLQEGLLHTMTGGGKKRG